MLNADSPTGKEMENSNLEAVNKPGNEEESVKMYILKPREVIQKSVDSIMKCKFQNTTLENMSWVIKYLLIDIKPIFNATEISMGKQDEEKGNIQFHFSDDDVLPTSLPTAKKCKLTI